MKKYTLGKSAILLAMASMSEGSFVLENKPPSTSNPKSPSKPIKEVVFSEQPEIISIIKDYNLIKKGLSKKGLRKQCSILLKVEDWIEKGFLTAEDLESNN